MREFAVAALIAGVAFAYQAGGQVKQTELPPPPGMSNGAPAAKPSAPPAPSKKGKLTPEQKAAEAAAEEARWGRKEIEESDAEPAERSSAGKPKVPAQPAPQPAAPQVAAPQPAVPQAVTPPVTPPVAPPSASVTPAKAAAGKRVAAFWIITPNK